MMDRGGIEMSAGASPGVAGRADLPEPRRRGYWGFGLVVFALIALAGAELVLVIAIPGTNYGGADGKAAQAEILTTLEFARQFDISNLNPLQGMGSQMMPMNVWVNPAYWPFAIFDKELAAEISGVIALICYIRFRDSRSSMHRTSLHSACLRDFRRIGRKCSFLLAGCSHRCSIAFIAIHYGPWLAA